MLHLMGHDSLPTFSYLHPSFSGVHRILAQLSLSCCLRLFYVSTSTPWGLAAFETSVGNMTFDMVQSVLFFKCNLFLG